MILWKIFVLFRFYARNDQPGRIKSQQYLEVVLKQLGSQRPRNHQGRVSAQIFHPRPMDKNTGRDIKLINIFSSISLFAERVRKEAEKETKSKT
ncbi:hypothetical protein V6N13_083171 [Hibiscus sabdariffa]